MARRTASLHKEYEKLLKEYGPQAWWPMRRGFSPKEWEVCVGAILTQNTNWRNVEKALDNLIKSNVVTPEATLKTSSRRLEQLVRPSGFYKQKAERLKTLAKFVLSYGSFSDFKRVERQELLKVKGVGPETADSILLYACGRPFFVIDAYTKRFARSLGMKPADYETLRAHFESRLPKDVALYKEFHALIVEWGKPVSSSQKPSRYPQNSIKNKKITNLKYK